MATSSEDQFTSFSLDVRLIVVQLPVDEVRVGSLRLASVLLFVKGVVEYVTYHAASPIPIDRRWSW